MPSARREGDYEPSPASGNRAQRPTIGCYRCPICLYEAKPSQMPDPVLGDLCPVCTRRLLTRAGVPHLEPVTIAIPVETPEEKTRPLQRKPGRISTVYIVRRVRPEELPETRETERADAPKRVSDDDFFDGMPPEMPPTKKMPKQPDAA